MVWLLPIFVSLLIVAALIEIAVALYAWRQRMTAGAMQLMALMVAAIIWTLAYALELVSTSLEIKIVWIGVAYLGVAFLPVLYLRFIIAYTRRATWLLRWRGAPWYIIPTFTIVLNWTNSAHGLYYQDMTLLSEGPFVLLSVTPGVWLWVFVTYSYALIALGVALIWRAMRDVSPSQRGRFIVIAVGAFAPWIANPLQLFGLHPLMPLDITPLAVAFSGLTILWGMFRYRLFSLAPIAREYLVEMMSDAVIVVNTRNRIIDLNPAAQRLFAPDNGTLVDQSIEVLLKPWPVLVQACHSSVEQVLEIEYDRSTHQVFEVKISPLIGNEGRINGRLLIWRNITQRKRDQALLRNRLRFIQLIQQAANDFVYCEATQIDEHIIAVLQKVATFTDVERSYIALITPEGDCVNIAYEWKHPAAAYGDERLQPIVPSKFAPWIEQLQRGEVVGIQVADMTSEHDVLREMLDALHIKTAVAIPLFIGTEFIGWIGFDTITRTYEFSDTTIEAFRLTGQLIASAVHRQRTEIALRQREQHFRSLFDHMLEGVALHRLIYDEHGRVVNYEIIDVNNQYERILNLRRDDVIHRRATEVYGTSEPPYLAEFSAVTVSGQPAHLEVYFAPMQKHFFISVSPLGPDQFATIFFDITARKQEEAERERLQTQLMHAQRLESIGRLAGGIAHDFNNILTVISGSADLALATMSPDSSAYSDVQTIQHSAGRAAYLVRQLLAFARRQPGHPQTVDANEVIEGMLPLVRRLIGENIHFIWAPAPYPCSITIDPHQFEQVVMNLLVNARDAMPDGGALTISTFITEMAAGDGYVRTTSFVRVTVEDTGVGIEAEILPHIFEPYFTTKPSGQGTGLGLATCLGIVQQYNGFIRVESEPGEGSRFEVFLPYTYTYASDPVVQLDDIQSHIQPEGGPETILVVEDEPMVRQMAVRILRDHGYTVFEAGNGHEAQQIVAMLAGAPLHLLLTDLVMPGMSGVELATWFQTRYPGASVLFMSGYARQLPEGAENPTIAFLQKPFSRHTLLNQVRRLLDVVAMRVSV
ncbi:MAG: histidine kinase N-terminal 7TM domain-containing protein [Roseiflexus sp.]